MGKVLFHWMVSQFNEKKKSRLYRDVFLNPVTRIPSLTQGLSCGLQGSPSLMREGPRGKHHWRRWSEGGALGAQEKKESPYSESSPDLL